MCYDIAVICEYLAEKHIFIAVAAEILVEWVLQYSIARDKKVCGAKLLACKALATCYGVSSLTTLLVCPPQILLPLLRVAAYSYATHDHGTWW